MAAQRPASADGSSVSIQPREQLARAMKHKDRLLVTRLDFDETHARPRNSFTDFGGVFLFADRRPFRLDFHLIGPRSWA